MLRKVVSLVLVAIAPAMLMAQTDSGAMVNPSGQSVTVNGNSLTRSSAVFSGDKIEVGGGSAATLTTAGSSAVFSANSTGDFEGTAVGLNSGTVAVTTSNRLGVKAGGITAAPTSEQARYQVSRGNCTVTVNAVQGDISLSDGTTVKQGDRVNRAEQGCAAALPPPAAAASAPGLSKGALEAIAIGAAGTAAAIAILTTGEKKPISPTAP